MALVLPGKTVCPLCGAVIASAENVVATSHFIGDRDDPLWKYSDAAMHRPCFLKWELRGAFIARFNEVVGSMAFGNGTRHRMAEDGSLEVTQGDPPPLRDADFRIDNICTRDGSSLVRVTHVPSGVEKTRRRLDAEPLAGVAAQLRSELEALLTRRRA